MQLPPDSLNLLNFLIPKSTYAIPGYLHMFVSNFTYSPILH